MAQREPVACDMGTDSSTVRAQPPLTIGLAITSHRGPAWLADVMTAIVDTGDAVVLDIIATGEGAGHQTLGIGRALLSAYDWIDGHVFGRSDDPTRILDLRHSVASGMFDRRQVPASGDPDIVLRLDGGMDPVDVWPAPSLGTWALVHGMGLPEDVRPTSIGMVPGGPELLLGRTVTVSQLVATSPTEFRVIGQVVSRVDGLSLRRGARGHVRKLPRLLARTVSIVRANGSLPDPVDEWHSDASTTYAGATLGSVPIALGLARIGLGYVNRLLSRKIAPRRWVIAISRDRRDPRGDHQSFRFLEAPAGRDWADPFPVRTAVADFLFVEEYVRATHRGRLAVVQLDESRRGWLSAETILDLPTHLSYPFVFEWSGSWYLLPEQAATGALQLYVADDFPTGWRWHSTALELPAQDATIAEIDGRWWMFAAVAVDGGIAADELHLFHAATPLGPWSPHVRNPVVSDVRTSRPAGKIYRHDNGWYRVAQDGAISYGHSISIIRIDRIDLEDYRQTVVDVVPPTWAPGLSATHTINSDGGLTVVDAIRTEPRASMWRPFSRHRDP